MRYLLDTNVLARSAEPGHAMYPAATGAVQALLQAGHDLFLVPQVLYEFWVVCTRPALVTTTGVAGKEAHDARLVAAMQLHGITHLLTFNSADFQRYSAIVVASPDDVLKTNP